MFVNKENSKRDSTIRVISRVGDIIHISCTLSHKLNLPFGKGNIYSFPQNYIFNIIMSIICNSVQV